MLLRPYNTDESASSNNKTIKKTADSRSKKCVVDRMAMSFANLQTFHRGKEG